MPINNTVNPGGSSTYTGGTNLGSIGSSPTPQDRLFFNQFGVALEQKANEKIIGVDSPTMIIKDRTNGSAVSDLTVTTFDTTTRADAANILITNSTGGSRTITAVAIRGKPVSMLTGDSGFIHDSYVDYEDIEKNGEMEFTFGNEDVTSAAQLNILADYYWKLLKDAKHVYVAEFTGMQHWIQPGEWYRLQIGGSGEAEYIDSVVECYNVREMRRPGELGQTVVVFREVEEAWKNNSSAIARFIASGYSYRIQRNDSLTIVVGSQYFPGNADIFCDGTADQTEINEAILFASYNGGGVVHLTRGQFNITAAIEMKSNVVLEGEGAATIIEKNANDYGIKAVGVSGTELTNVSIKNLRITSNAGDTYLKTLIYMTYTDDSVVDGVYADAGHAGISASYCDNLIINGCTVSNVDTGIAVSGERVRVSNNSISNVNAVAFGTCVAIYSAVNTKDLVIVNNTISGVSSSQSSPATGMYLYDINGIVISSNTIEDVESTEDDINAYGIYIACGANGGYSNYVLNNNLIRTVASADESYGIYINGFNVSNLISGSTIEGCVVNTISGTTYGFGIYVAQYTDRIKISDCQVNTVDDYGIDMDGDNGTIELNTVTGCVTGIAISSLADRTLTIGNHSYGNTTSQITDSGTNGTTANNLVA